MEKKHSAFSVKQLDRQLLNYLYRDRLIYATRYMDDLFERDIAGHNGTGHMFSDVYRIAWLREFRVFNGKVVCRTLCCSLHE